MRQDRPKTKPIDPLYRFSDTQGMSKIINPFRYAASPLRFQQASTGDNLLVIDAQHYHDKVAASGRGWTDVAASDSVSGTILRADGSSYLAGIFADGGYVRFRCRFTQSGTHKIWIRKNEAALSASSDSLFVYFDGSLIATLNNHRSGRWLNTGGAGWTTYSVGSTGDHTIEIQTREPGMFFDRLIATTNLIYDAVTNGDGEIESPAN